MKKKILVTGGTGYIGSHTIVDLIQHGYEVIAIDNYSRSNMDVLDGIEKITGIRVKNYVIDLCDLHLVEEVFVQEKNIVGVIHFAAYKSVVESVSFPEMYFENNMGSLENILINVKKYKVSSFVYSSSCSVYGNTKELPVTENTTFEKAESPYAETKQLGEQMVHDYLNQTNIKAVILRYFNPAGAHPSGYIGETIAGRPSYLIPFITKTAVGIYPYLEVFGNDYNTRDGSCIRDYIHVCDIAHAHTLALECIEKSIEKGIAIFNLGSGKGVSVLEAIKAFEESTDIHIKYKISNRRPGDVEAIYSDNSKAKTQLKWQTQYTLLDIMKTAYAWEKKLLI